MSIKKNTKTKTNVGRLLIDERNRGEGKNRCSQQKQQQHARTHNHTGKQNKNRVKDEQQLLGLSPYSIIFLFFCMF
jgi:hypothetical protein